MDTDLPLADELTAVFARATNMLLSEETVPQHWNSSRRPRLWLWTMNWQVPV
ncbi:hypothetical protein [Arthrobacter sp. M4]|uniref:hypothetical protein n=1 Tax=Arthrobacter sp. M4 TaxID=218160 RepID=UPI001CDB6FF6|nr:hypothetical protein [Arthrobacter sp. M4]MCA4135189.1 hypothetical protein [Arthrobacter sp. M4]